MAGDSVDAGSDPSVAPSLSPPLGEKVAEIRVSKVWANVLSVALGVAVAAVTIPLVRFMPHAVEPDMGQIWEYVALLAVLMVAHELLHAYGATRWGKAPRSAIKFGFSLKGLMPYYHCRVPIELAAYRVAALLPFYVTVPLAVAVMLVRPSVWMAAGVCVVVAACAGDFIMFRRLRRFDPSSLVADHPTEPGCDVYLPARAPDGGAGGAGEAKDGTDRERLPDDAQDDERDDRRDSG